MEDYDLGTLRVYLGLTAKCWINTFRQNLWIFSCVETKCVCVCGNGKLCLIN